MNHAKFYLGLFMVFVISFVGCVSVKSSAKYTPPSKSENFANYPKIINKSFDDTWDALIEYAAGAFFSIDNFEKDSGLMTLTFGASNPSAFITGGQWSYSNPNINFSGDYVDYVTQYSNGKLDGKMNIVVKEINSNQTRVTVNARYIFSWMLTAQPLVTDTISFDSGTCGSFYPKNRASGTPATRTICPTYKAEKAVLSAMQYDE